MTDRSIRIKPEADVDLKQAFLYYESLKTDLGDEFLEEVQRALTRLVRFPEIAPQVYNDYRQLLVSRFPFRIFYKLEPEIIAVYGVIHASRDFESLLDSR